ncbi:MAG: hypothetical protein WBC91_02010 [Phototrophicaceae bacterium]
MANAITWIHADNLNPNQPALDNDNPAIFVWDDTLLSEWEISFKRIVFIYECLLELPVIIRRGNVASEVAQFATEHHATQILTPYSPSPRHRIIIEQITTHNLQLTVDIVHDAPFINYDKQVDLKRFSRYWRKVEKYAMQTTDT